MVNKREIQQLLQREPTENPTVSLYLDMSVGSDNKRSHTQFLNKQRTAFPALDGERGNSHREHAGAFFDRVESWLDTEFDQKNRGIALFAELGGDFFHAIQLPRALSNRLVVQERPAVAPLAELLEHERHWGILVVDREHLRMVSTFMDQVEEDQLIAPEAIPISHRVQAGGEAHKDYQKRKAEETRHFWKDFAEEVGKLQQRRGIDGFALLGTTENVRNFLEFLPQPLRDRVVHTGTVPDHRSAPELVRELAPVFTGIVQQEEARAVSALLDRVRQSHFATSGFHDTLVQLQEGKVDRLIIARNAERDGVQCTQCGFTLVRRDGACPYCGGALRDGVDLVESMIRMAAQQEAKVEFVSGDPMDQVNGVGALLRF